MMPELLASDACALLCGGGTTGAGTTSSPKVAQLRDCRTRKRIRPKSSSTPERTVRPGTLQHRRTSTRVRPGAISHGTLTRELSSALSSDWGFNLTGAYFVNEDAPSQRRRPVRVSPFCSKDCFGQVYAPHFMRKVILGRETKVGRSFNVDFPLESPHL